MWRNNNSDIMMFMHCKAQPPRSKAPVLAVYTPTLLRCFEIPIQTAGYMANNPNSSYSWQQVVATLVNVCSEYEFIKRPICTYYTFNEQPQSV